MEDGIVPGVPVSVQLDKESKAFHGFLMGRELECGFCVGLAVCPSEKLLSVGVDCMGASCWWRIDDSL